MARAEAELFGELPVELVERPGGAVGELDLDDIDARILDQAHLVDPGPADDLVIGEINLRRWVGFIVEGQSDPGPGEESVEFCGSTQTTAFPGASRPRGTPQGRMRRQLAGIVSSSSCPDSRL